MRSTQGAPPEAQTAIQQMNGFALAGRPLRVNEAQQRFPELLVAARAGEVIEMTIPTEKKGFFNKLFGQRAA